MKEIVTSGQLVKIAAAEEVFMTDYEASIIIGYMSGHGYCLAVDGTGKLYRQDVQDDDADEEYSLREAVLFAVEMNAALQEEAGDDKGYLKSLRDDESILAGLYAFFEPGVGRSKYVVEITETMQKLVAVVAATPEEAHRTVEDRWMNGYYSLDADDFKGVTFDVRPMHEEPPVKKREEERKKRKTVVAYLDGEWFMDVTKAAWAGNVEAGALMRRMAREYKGHDVEFRVEEV